MTPASPQDPLARLPTTTNATSTTAKSTLKPEATILQSPKFLRLLASNQRAQANYQSTWNAGGLIQSTRKPKSCTNPIQASNTPHEKPANDGDTEAKGARNRIRQLEVQCKNRRYQLADGKATITEQIDNAVTKAKENAALSPATCWLNPIQASNTLRTVAHDQLARPQMSNATSIAQSPRDLRP